MNKPGFSVKRLSWEKVTSPCKYFLLVAYKVEKNCRDRFSHIILSPVDFFSQLESIDSRQGATELEDCNTHTVPKTAIAVSRICMIDFDFILPGSIL